MTLGLLAMAGLVGGGIVSAHGGGVGPFFGGHGPGGHGTPAQCSDNMTVRECRTLLRDPCNDAMTVGECEAALEAQHKQFEQERQAQCVAETGNATLCEEHPMRGPGGPPHGGPGGWDRRGPHGGRGPPHGAPGNGTNDHDADDS